MTKTLAARRSGGPDRFSDGLYTVAEAARYLLVPTSTLNNWTHGYTMKSDHRPTVVGAPILSTVGPTGGASIPFIGLAEGLVLAAIRRSGVPLQRIRPALDRLSKDFGLTHALASRQLFTDGAEVIYDYANKTGDDDATRDLIVVRNGQRVFAEIVEEYLQLITFGEDGYAQVLRLPGYTSARVIADPARGFGQPIFADGGARLDDVLGLFRAGEPLSVVAEEYGVPGDALEDAVRVATQAA
jgi:uncharacterized protein (DUF433 family)